MYSLNLVFVCGSFFYDVRYYLPNVEVKIYVDVYNVHCIVMLSVLIAGKKNAFLVLS